MSKINTRKLESDSTTGFGTNGRDSGGRFYNTDGIPNVRKKGIGFFEGISWFHTMINLKTFHFILLILFGFIGINLLFTFIYLLIGTDHLVGIRQGGPFEIFMEVFFFSAQTLTTVGYGRVSPMGNLAGLVSTLEAFAGLMSFALASGLFFARFSRPFMHVRFSKNVLFSPFKEGKALMFRVAPFNDNVLSEVEVKLTLAIRELENGKQVNRFYPLTTTVSRINALVLSWTVVHEIKEDSPLFGFSEQDLMETPFEILVFIKAFDETYANQVIRRYSYLSQDIICNAKFQVMYHPDPYSNSTILDFDKLNDYELVGA